ncbi:MAG TPA: hypothetical protein VF513_06160 [Stenotrophomonas sp.]
MFSTSYPYLPLWLLTILFLLLLLGAREIGALIRRQRDAWRTSKPDFAEDELAADEKADGDAFAMTSVLGLLALLIGFTFSIALGRYDERRQLVVKEANALGTMWLRTDLLPVDEADRVRDVLRRYIDVRVEFAKADSADEEARRYARTVSVQAELWDVMTKSVASFQDTPRASLLISTTNESIDLAAERYAARQDHIPLRILRMLLFFAILAAGLVGYERAQQRKATSLLLLAFSLAVSLVLDLDRPTTGMTTVPQEPMLDLQRSVH